MKPRTRDSGTGIAEVNSMFTRTYDDGDSRVYGPYVHPESVYDDRMLGFDIPNFHKRRSSGELLPMTPFDQYYRYGRADGFISTRNETHPSDPSEYFTDTYTTNVPFYHGWLISEGTALSFASRRDTREFVQAAAARIYAQGWDGLTFALEFRQVVTMFKSLAVRLRNFLSRHGAQPENVADLWLEGRYGWRTLIRDIQDVSEALSNLNDKRERFSERVGVSEKFSETSIIVNDDWSSMTNTFTVVDEISASWRGSVVADIEPPKFQFNPVVSAWELIPWSFVVDWFLSVGRTLEALSFLTFSSGHTAAGGINVTVKRSVTHSASFKPGFSGTCTFSGECVERITLRTPCSVPQYPLPQLNLDVFKVIDLLALLDQFLRRR